MKHTANDDAVFTCQAKCMRFLAKHGMDFGKVFLKGITYMNAEEEAKFNAEQKIKYRKQNQVKLDGNTGTSNSAGQLVDETSLKTLDLVRANIRHWLDTNFHGKCLNLSPYNATVQRLILNNLVDEFPEVHFKVVRDKVTSESFIRVLRANHFANKNATWNTELYNAIGFRRVIKLLIDHMQKNVCPLIGHNMLLDLAHIIHKFVAPLPKDLQTFKQILHSTFPYIIDTKFISESKEDFRRIFNKNTSLEKLFERTKHKPFLQHHNNDTDTIFAEYDRFFLSSSLKKKQESHGMHSAVWDAFMTGWIFFQMSHYIASKQQLQTPEHEMKKASEPITIRSISHLKEYINVVNVMKSDVHLCVDPIREQRFKPNRSNVLYVTGLAGLEDANEQLTAILSNYGSFNIDWIDESTAFIRIIDQKRAITCVEELCLNRDRTFSSNDDTLPRHLIVFKKALLNGVNFLTYDEAENSGILAAQLALDASVSPSASMSLKRTLLEDQCPTNNNVTSECISPPKKRAKQCTVM
jgi:poly(A)-specific ribonuclease